MQPNETGEAAMESSETHPQSGLYEKRWAALAVLALSLMVISLDHTILNVALPSLRDDLGATASELTWVMDAYVLVFAGLLLAAGSLGDRFGRAKALWAGLLIFGTGSVASALSGTPEMLIASRALMGVGGALIMPSTLSIITAIFPSDERPKAIAAWSAVAGLGIVLGPVLGGILVEYFDWTLVFWVNVPLIAGALIAGKRLVPDSRDPDARPIDGPGVALSIVGLTALVWAIIEAPERGWTSPQILAGIGLGVVLMAAFGYWQTRAPHPMLDLRLFRNPRFSASSAAIALTFAAMMGSVFLLTQYLQGVLGYGALEAGLRTAPIGLIMIPAAVMSERFVDRLGTKVVVSAGLAIAAAGLGTLSGATPDSGYGLVLAALLMLGFGMGTAMAPATDAIMGSVPEAHASIGSAVNDTTRMVGGALGLAVLSSVLSSGYRSDVESATQALPADAAEAAGDGIGGAAAVAAQMPGSSGETLMTAAESAFTSGLADAAIVAAGVALLGSLIAAWFLPAREKSGEKGEIGEDAGVASEAAPA
jgi:EmrB/QacA subfamily drug resistance transporter